MPDSLPPIERHPWTPFLPPNARLLMLGSFPPDRKRWAMDFFYPNRSNMMWQIFGQVFYDDEKYLIDEEHKGYRLNRIKELLEQRGIALYDTATAVRRLQGNASDKFLEVVEKTNLVQLLEQIPQCRHIVCTGQKAAETLCEDFGAKVPAMGQYSEFTIGGRSMQLHRLPSSSRAYPMPLGQKAEYYRTLMQSINIL